MLPSRRGFLPRWTTTRSGSAQIHPTGCPPVLRRFLSRPLHRARPCSTDSSYLEGRAGSSVVRWDAFLAHRIVPPKHVLSRIWTTGWVGRTIAEGDNCVLWQSVWPSCDLTPAKQHFKRFETHPRKLSPCLPHFLFCCLARVLDTGSAQIPTANFECA